MSPPHLGPPPRERISADLVSSAVARGPLGTFFHLRTMPQQAPPSFVSQLMGRSRAPVTQGGLRLFKAILYYPLNQHMFREGGPRPTCQASEHENKGDARLGIDGVLSLLRGGTSLRHIFRAAEGAQLKRGPKATSRVARRSFWLPSA